MMFEFRVLTIFSFEVSWKELLFDFNIFSIISFCVFEYMCLICFEKYMFSIFEMIVLKVIKMAFMITK